MEDNLESVLHCDDKEKLRRKLALLQREYSRTVQRLQRAERSDAVRKHVRSRISEQNLQDQTDPGTASTSPNPALPSLSLVSPARTAPGSASPLGLAGDSTVAASCLVESENPRWRSPSVRFLLSVDDSCPRTPDLNPDPAGGHRRSPSLRLRSRRSRQRWERRGRAQGGEGGRAGSRYDTETSEDGLEPDARTEKEEEEGEKGKEEEERETPDKEAMKERRAGEEREQRKYGQKEIEKEGANLRRDGEKEREEGGDSGAVGASELGAVGLCDLSLCDTGGALDSCTLVEGLPFPVEYYIRTTRRMASSQSHRDLQAVILNQLNRGRHRRSRGRTSNTHTLSDSLAQPSNSQTNHTPVEGPSANQMLTSESGTNQSECLPSRACSVRPVRGRRRRGRGRRPRLGRSLSLDSEPPAPGPDNTQTPATLTLASQPLPGGGGPERWPLSGGVEEQLYPIFRRSCGSPLIHTPKQRKESVWSLLLPSSHPPHLPSLSPGGPAVHPGSLGRVISTFDLQDFHLPDDQFGRLKLQKLRASSAVSVPEPEPFSPYNMRRRHGKDSVHGLHGDTGGLTSKAPTSEPISLSLTPPVTDCVAPVESVEQSIDRSIGQHLTDHPIDQQSTDSLGLSTDLHSEYHSVCQSTDHPVDQPISHESTDHPVDQPIGHESTDHPVDQPIGHQSTDHPVDQPIGHQSTDHPVDQPIGHQSTDHQLTVLVGQSTDFPSVDQQTGLLPAEGPSLRTETETECPTECLTKCTTECPSFHTKTDPKCPSTCPTEFSIDCLTKCPALRTETDAECAVPPSPSLLLLSPSLTSHTPHGHTLSFPLSSSPPLPSLGMTPNLLTPNPLSPNPDIPLSLPDSPQLPSLGAVTLPLSCAPCPPTLTLPLSCTPCPPTLPLPLSCAPCPPTLPLPLSCAPCPPHSAPPPLLRSLPPPL
ncbi:uncharacterized protein LOC121560204 [Coregonus clupeaformis]|uniref:uncharacterized protein LOC121560204 n=1 Tax=Coregonus clupeaformis TaxID=59861 RepID=UPI001E1C5655|nr:uncharacterized protein LOC121560204 [Coregonus clupeaformis]